MPSPSPQRILPQLISVLIQRHFSFNPTLLPSPLFPGFSSSLLSSLLSSLPRFFPNSPFLPSLALSFYSWAQSHSHFSHDEMTCRHMARLLVNSNSLPSLWLFLRNNHTLVTTATVTALIATLGQHGLAKSALNLFYRMKQFHCKPDVQCYNTLISVLCRNRDFRKARFLLDQMELPGARCKPDLYTYTIFITFYCKRGLETGCKKAIRRRIWEANHMFRRMVFNGFVPDVVTYNCLINGLCKTYRIERAHELFDEMLLKGVLPNRVTYNSFIRYYSVVNEADKALRFMREMEEREHGKPSSSSYTPIIHSLCENGRVNEARDLLVEMIARGHVPREFTYKLVCGALRSKGADDLSQEICWKIETGIRERIKQVVQFLQWKCKTELEPRDKQVNSQAAIETPEQQSPDLRMKKDWTMNWFDQFMILSKRSFRERSGDYLDKLRILQAVGVAALLGLLWWNSQIGTEAQLRYQIGLIFYICIFWTPSSLFGAVYVFPFEKLYLVKERKADMYRLSAYYISSTLCDMVAHVFYPVIFMAILYFIAHLRKTVASFFLKLVAVELIVITSQGTGELLGAAILSVKRAGTMASLVLMLFLLTGGYYVQHIPKFMRWLKYISFMHYGFRLLLKVQYSGDLTFNCQAKQGCQSLQSSPSFDTIKLDGGMQEALILVFMALVYRLLVYFCLRRRISLISF